MTCHGAGLALAAVANNPPRILWSLVVSLQLGCGSTVFLYTSLLYRDTGSMSGPSCVAHADSGFPDPVALSPMH